MLGIGLADTLYFRALNALGAARVGIIGNLFSLSNRDSIERERVGERVSARNLAQFVELVDSGAVNKATAVEVLAEMWATGRDAANIVEAEGLGQISDGAAGGVQADR